MIKTHKTELIPQSKFNIFEGAVRDGLAMYPGVDGVVIQSDGKTGTAYDDSNYSPWDSVAAELISGNTEPAKKAVQETLKFIKAKKPMLNEIRKRRADIARMERVLTATDEMMEWMSGANGFHMEKCETPAWHRLKQAVHDGNAFTASEDDEKHFFPQLIPYATLDDEPQIFLMQHDWAKALAGAEDEKGRVLDTTGYRLPFPVCCFEVQLGGRRMVTVMRTAEDDRMKFVIGIELGDMWYIGTECDLIDFLAGFNQELDEKNITKENYVLDNIAAMCICLDADVLETEVIRAPHKLNKQREKLGKVPVNDHHIVSLARRHRISNPMEHASDGSRIGTVRGHWRRGHWRHYNDHKTWIKWMLVGNLDLGFVSKEYKA